MVNILLIGDVPPQSEAVWEYLSTTGHRVTRDLDVARLPDLIIVAGYRRLVPPSILAIPSLGTIGFHSAKLPEYPGRAPVAWALLRGDRTTKNTMLYLDEGVDSGDIIDEVVIPVTTPERMYHMIARTCVVMLAEHLPAILDGTAPRTPQDPAKRGPLTTKDGWDRLAERERMATGHA
jgi:methionyl-tRNA formyltransferase